MRMGKNEEPWDKSDKDLRNSDWSKHSVFIQENFHLRQVKSCISIECKVNITKWAIIRESSKNGKNIIRGKW